MAKKPLELLAADVLFLKLEPLSGALQALPAYRSLSLASIAAVKVMERTNTMQIRSRVAMEARVMTLMWTMLRLDQKKS